MYWDVVSHRRLGFPSCVTMYAGTTTSFSVNVAPLIAGSDWYAPIAWFPDFP